MSLYATAVKKPVTTALVFVAVVIMGLFSLTRLSVDLFPEIETNMIMVMTAYPGASASATTSNLSRTSLVATSISVPYSNSRVTIEMFSLDCEVICFRSLTP